MNKVFVLFSGLLLIFATGCFANSAVVTFKNPTKDTWSVISATGNACHNRIETMNINSGRSKSFKLHYKKNSDSFCNITWSNGHNKAVSKLRFTDRNTALNYNKLLKVKLSGTIRLEGNIVQPIYVDNPPPYMCPYPPEAFLCKPFATNASTAIAFK